MNTINFTNQEVINLTKGLRLIKGYRGIGFNHAVVRNLDRAEAEYKLFHKQETDITAIASEFDSEREALAIEYSEKNEAGQPVVIRDTGTPSYKIKEGSVDEFNKKHSELLTKHKTSLDKRDEEWKAYEKFLGQKNESFEPYMIDKDHIPADIITEDYKTIFKLIKE